MAVTSNLAKTAMTLRYKEGVDQSGKDIIKTKKFSNIKVTAGNQNIYDVSAAFSPLLKYPVMEVIRTDESVLLNF